MRKIPVWLPVGALALYLLSRSSESSLLEVSEGRAKALEEQRKATAAYYRNLSQQEFAAQLEEIEAAMQFAQTSQEKVNALLATQAVSRWPLWLSLVITGGTIAFNLSPAILAAYGLTRAATVTAAAVAAGHAYSDISSMIDAVRDGAGINTIALSTMLGRHLVKKKFGVVSNPTSEFLNKLNGQFVHDGMHVLVEG